MLIVFVLFQFIAFAQVDSNLISLQDYDDVQTRAEFKKLESYLVKSYLWKPELRVQYLTRLYEVSDYLENDSLRTFYSEKLGTLYRELDSISLALEFLNKSLGHCYDAKSCRIAYNSLGGLHSKSRDYNTALDYYFKSLEEAKSLNDGSEAYPLGNISEVYAALKEYDNAIKYLKHSIEFSKDLVSPEKEYSLIYDYSYLANHYSKIENRDSTDKYIAYILENISKIDTIQRQKFLDVKFIGYFYLSEICLHHDNLSDAAVYINKSESNAQPFYLSSIYILRARLLIKQKKYDAALALLKSEKVTEEYSGREEVYKYKAECLDQLGRHQEASRVRDEIIELQSKVFVDAQAKFSALANVKYETLKKNEEILSLKKEQEIKSLTINNQRYLVAISSILLLFLSVASFLLWKNFKSRQSMNMRLKKEVDHRTKELQKANNELKTLNYIASHDLKEPLRNISTFSELIQMKMDSNDSKQFKEYFSFINKSIAHSNQLIENISEFSAFQNLEDIELTEVNLNSVTDNIKLALNSIISDKNGSVIRDELPSIQSNTTMLYSVLKNLIENGLKFNESSAPEVLVSYKSTDEHDIIVVKDNGIGIDKKYQDYVFKSYKKLHNRNQYHGTGLGLSIVKMLIEKLNGNFELESSIGSGSMFTIFLPKN